ncbi:aspartate/glutamate racemase family protein, partial [Desulfobulbus sp. TB]|nr:aspartate/glutamate racemase family protein [Desulfobulbus sp. TB]
PLLVPLIEEGWLNRRETKMILRRYLHPLRRCQIDTLILGCTHYPLLTRLIRNRIGKQVQLIDSSVETAGHVKSFLDNSPEITSNTEEKIKNNPHFPKKSCFFCIRLHPAFTEAGRRNLRSKNQPYKDKNK